MQSNQNKQAKQSKQNKQPIPKEVIERFLEKGGEIERVPPAVSGLTEEKAKELRRRYGKEFASGKSNNNWQRVSTEPLTAEEKQNPTNIQVAGRVVNGAEPLLPTSPFAGLSLEQINIV